MNNFSKTNGNIVSSCKNIQNIKTIKNNYSKKNRRTNTMSYDPGSRIRNNTESSKKIYVKTSNVLGVDEGMIKLPELKPSLEKWKKLTPEQLELKHKEEMAGLIKDQSSITNDSYKIGNEELEQESEYIIIKTAENEIKKLNGWDVLNTERKKPLMKQTSINFAKYAENFDSPALKWFMEIKNNPKEIALLNRSPHLKDFFDNINEEQKAIFNQSLNINKKKFNFEVFTKGIVDEENETESSFKGTTIDFYREIMKDKLKVEEYLKADLNKVAVALHTNKTRKKHLMKKIVELSDSLHIIEGKQKQILIESEIVPKKRAITDFTYNRDPYSKRAEKESKIAQQQRRIEHSNDMIAKIKKINSDRNEIKFDLEINQKDLQEIDIEIRHLKFKLHNKMNDHQKYYFEQLKKGIDVRRDGILWIVVRLIELKAYIEYSKFPKFLTTEQIEYVLEISYKHYELSELIKLFQILKKKQKEMKENHFNDNLISASTSNTMLKEKEKESDQEPGVQARHSSKNKKIFYNSEYHNQLNEIYSKYENVINICLNEESEDKNIKAISKDLHNRILKTNSMNDNNELDSLYFLPGSLAAVFNQNNKFRQYFDDIVYLNLEIVKKEQELKEIKSNEMIKFRKESESKVTKNTVENEMIFAALFGNGINI